MWGAERRGEGAINRPECSTRLRRRAANLVGSATWYRQTRREVLEPTSTNRRRPKARNSPRTPQPYPEGVLFVPHTPGGELKRRLRELEDRALASRKVGRIRMVERVGRTLLSQLANMAPWTREHCGQEECMACATKPGQCKMINATYHIQCQECKLKGIKRVNIVETCRSVFDRIQEHKKALEDKDMSCGVVKHWAEAHPDRDSRPEYEVKTLATHKSALERQLWEALEIGWLSEDQHLNTKTEWGINPIPRNTVMFLEQEARVSGSQGQPQEGGDLPGGSQNPWKQETTRDRSI